MCVRKESKTVEPDKRHYEQELVSADKTKPLEVPSEGSYFFKSKSSHSLTVGARRGT